MKKIYSILSILILCSCTTKEHETEKTPLLKTDLSVVVKHTVPKKVRPLFLEELEGWKEYELLEEFTSKFHQTTPNEALSNALEMRDLITHLKDNIKPAIFNIPSLNARINVLYSEAKRLADITFIPAIKITEINIQVEKTLHAFSALNSKINTILSQKNFEDAIKSTSKAKSLNNSKLNFVSKKK